MEGVIPLWKQANAVCFDVDSTVVTDEGIDVLADHCGAGTFHQGCRINK